MVSNSISSNDAGSPASHSRYRPVLHGLVIAASAQVNAQINDFTVRMVSALLEASQARTDAKEANACFAAGNLLKNNAYPFYHLVSIAVRKALQDAVDALDTDVQQQPPFQPDELTLVPFADIENRLLLERAARPLDQAHAALLSTVGLRLATLSGRADLAPADNPFRPAALLAAFDCAWREFTPDTALHALMLQMMQGGLVPDVGPMLQVVDRACIDAGILPELAARSRIRKSRSGSISAKPAPTDPLLMAQLRQMFGTPGAAIASDAAAIGEATVRQPLRAETATAPAPAPTISPALSAYLSNLQARTRRPPSTAAAHGPAPGEKTPAANSTAAIATAVPDAVAPHCSLRELQRQMPRAEMTRADEATIDVMTRIFDAVFRDPNIPAEMKELIGYLQIPVLKAALLDKEFFFEDAHPARQLISLMTRSSIGWDRSRGRADPLYQAIERNVDRVQQFDAEITLFADVVADLEAFLAEEEATAGVRLAAPITQALAQEKIREATRAATDDVAQRVATGAIAPFVETFLEDRWVPVLAMAYSVRDRKPQVLASAIRTMDDLVWSVRPKLTAQQRHELVEKLPALLTSLNKWLSILKWDDAARLQFFADLAECHASIVRAPLELSPQRQLELAVEAARLATERRLQKNNAPTVSPAADLFVEQVSALERGAWFEFLQADAGPRRVKLAWVSPLRSLYIFTTVHREEAFSLSADVLAENFRQQLVRIVDADGFVDRALSDVLEEAQRAMPALQPDTSVNA